MSLQLELNLDRFVSEKSGDKMRVHSYTDNKLEQTSVVVEMPEDIQAKRESVKRHRGSAIGDSLHNVIKEMHTAEREGTRYPKNLKDRMEKMYKYIDWSNASDSETKELMTTLDAVKKISLAKPLTVYEDDDVVAVKCACVNGECSPGESECHKCYSGWKGRLCDIPDRKNSEVRRPDDARMKGAKISDDLDEQGIFSKIVKRDRSAGETVQAKNGRRFGNKSSHDDDHFVPRQKYGSESTGTKMGGSTKPYDS